MSYSTTIVADIPLTRISIESMRSCLCVCMDDDIVLGAPAPDLLKSMLAIFGPSVFLIFSSFVHFSLL